MLFVEFCFVWCVSPVFFCVCFVYITFVVFDSPCVVCVSGFVYRYDMSLFIVRFLFYVVSFSYVC